MPFLKVAPNVRSAWRSSKKESSEARIFFGILPSGQLYAVPKGRRTAVREAERTLRRNPFGIATQRFRALRSGGFRSTKLSISTKLE